MQPDLDEEFGSHLPLYRKVFQEIKMEHHHLKSHKFEILFSIVNIEIPLNKIDISDLIQSHAFPMNHIYKTAIPNSNETSSEIRTKLINSTMRFVKDSDKLLATCSILLKSRIFHNHNSTRNNPLPIVDLPRSELGKPYLHSVNNDEVHHTLSISHQHPFVGGVYLHTDTNSGLRVGLDIVVLEDNSYFNLSYMKSSFTVREWKIIKNIKNKSEQKKEVLIRWSMKEAFTKALGMGLLLNFGSLDIYLEDIDNHHDDYQSCWNQLIDITKIQKRARITVPSELNPQIWDFSFFNATDICANNDINEVNSTPPSCACVCVGPIIEITRISSYVSPDIVLNVLPLSDLLHWHQTN